MNNHRWVTVLAAVVLVGSVVELAWRTRSFPFGSFGSATARAVGRLEPIAHVPMLGDPDAPLVMIEYADFTCTHCSDFAREMLPEIRRRYIEPGTLLLGFRTWVVRGESDVFGVSAAVTASCAAQQHRFWPMHDRLFLRPVELDRAGALALAADLKLDTNAFARCLSSSRFERFGATSERAASYGLHGTPSFLIGRHESGGVRVVRATTGVPQLATLRRWLDDLVAEVE